MWLGANWPWLPLTLSWTSERIRCARSQANASVLPRIGRNETLNLGERPNLAASARTKAVRQLEGG